MDKDDCIVLFVFKLPLFSVVAPPTPLSVSVPGQLLLDFHRLARVELDPEAHGERLLSH